MNPKTKERKSKTRKVLALKRKYGALRVPIIERLKGNGGKGRMNVTKNVIKTGKEIAQHEKCWTRKITLERTTVSTQTMISNLKK